MRTRAATLLLFLVFSGGLRADEEFDFGDRLFRARDVFDLEYASDPRISSDGERIVYVRNGFDVRTDRGRRELFLIRSDGAEQRPLPTGSTSTSSPRWAPDGESIVFVEAGGDAPRIVRLWLDTLQTAELARLERAPSSLAWSPDGNRIAFSMFVEEKSKPYVEMPPKPEGAEWAEPPKLIRKVRYRADGRGYLEDGAPQLFVIPADGGTPRRVTPGSYPLFGAPSWTADSRSLVFSASRDEDWEYDRNTEIYAVDLEERVVKQLTDRKGGDYSPRVSPDGDAIAYLGWDDKGRMYAQSALYLMNRDGSGARLLTTGLDRPIAALEWAADGESIYIQYADEGRLGLDAVDLDGGRRTLAKRASAGSLGRPYAGGSFTVSENGKTALSWGNALRPNEVAVLDTDAGEPEVITDLNSDLLGPKELGQVEELWYESSHDNRRVQGWVVKPPDFDPAKKYPLILEIHGGPWSDYGPSFAAELQLYAAAGHVVLYTNPRGSTGYGNDFAQEIHHEYPGNDYDDLMSGVDAVLEQGYVDAERLYITGGSGGGVLSSWTIGKTDRFRAAVVVKPVINWYSFALTTDGLRWAQHNFPGPPWEHAEHYLKISPISLVGSVTTPTMVMVGEQDHRTPPSESEQYYQALKLRKVEAALVRVPGASHNIAGRPSRLIAKVAYVLKWFEDHSPE